MSIDGFDDKKFKELVFYICSSLCNSGIAFGLLRLTHYLFLVDLQAGRVLGSTVTGTEYIKKKDGMDLADPGKVDSVIADLDMKVETRRFRPLVEADMSSFSEKEMGIIAKVLKEFATLSEAQLKEVVRRSYVFMSTKTLGVFQMT